MPNEPENHTVRLLQELRTEMRGRFDGIDESFADLTRRVDGNTLLLNVMAGVLHDHEQRLSKLEGTSP